MSRTDSAHTAVRIEAGAVQLDGDLMLPAGAGGLVLFAHGSGSSRKSPRNRFVAQYLVHSGMATLLFDLLTRAEEQADARTTRLRFDIELLTARLLAASDWVARDDRLCALPLGYFGASTGAAAALVAAAAQPRVGAVVSRGGRPDLAGAALKAVQAPTLLIVGGADGQVLDLNRAALAALTCAKELAIVPGATHLFEEPGALEQVAELAAAWFLQRLRRPPNSTSGGRRDG